MRQRGWHPDCPCCPPPRIQTTLLASQGTNYPVTAPRAPSPSHTSSFRLSHRLPLLPPTPSPSHATATDPSTPRPPRNSESASYVGRKQWTQSAAGGAASRSVGYAFQRSTGCARAATPRRLTCAAWAQRLVKTRLLPLKSLPCRPPPRPPRLFWRENHLHGSRHRRPSPSPPIPSCPRPRPRPHPRFSRSLILLRSRPPPPTAPPRRPWGL